MAKSPSPAAPDPSIASKHSYSQLFSLFLALAAAASAVTIDRYVSGKSQPVCTCICSRDEELNTGNQSSLVEDYRVEWMAAAAAEASSSKEESSSLPRFGLMRMLWQTPIYHVSIGAFDHDFKSLNVRIQGEVKKHFDNLLLKNQDKVDMTGWKENGVNQLFFEWQTTGGWKTHFSTLPDMKKLFKFFHFMTDAFLETVGKSETEIKQRNREIHAWATYHYSCIAHLQHTHPSNMISGVYYVKVPSDAGSLIFSDPRGPLPPFDDSITIVPKEGDLILFPSWLAHQVMPTPGDDARISIAFNMPGKWEDTSSIGTSFPLEME